MHIKCYTHFLILLPIFPFFYFSTWVNGIKLHNEWWKYASNVKIAYVFPSQKISFHWNGNGCNMKRHSSEFDSILLSFPFFLSFFYKVSLNSFIIMWTWKVFHFLFFHSFRIELFDFYMSNIVLVFFCGNYSFGNFDLYCLSIRWAKKHKLSNNNQKIKSNTTQSIKNEGIDIKKKNE